MITESFIWGIAIAMVLVPAAAAIVAGAMIVLERRRQRAADRANLAVLTRPNVREGAPNA